MIDICYIAGRFNCKSVTVDNIRMRVHQIINLTSTESLEPLIHRGNVVFNPLLTYGLNIKDI